MITQEFHLAESNPPKAKKEGNQEFKKQYSYMM